MIYFNPGKSKIFCYFYSQIFIQKTCSLNSLHLTYPVVLGLKYDNFQVVKSHNLMLSYQLERIFKKKGSCEGISIVDLFLIKVRSDLRIS
jgi:hypothetical protein